MRKTLAIYFPWLCAAPLIEPEPGHAKRTHARKMLPTWFPWLVCGLGAVFYCYEYYLRITPSVMANDLMRVHHLHAEGFGNLAAFYYYAYTPMQLPVGMLLDRFGPKRLLVLATLSCAVGSFLFANLHFLWIAQLGRFLVGFGSAFAFVGTLKLATIWLPPERFALISGLATMLGMLGAILGDVSLTYFVQWHGWQYTVIFSSILGLVLAVIMLLVIRDTPHGSRQRQLRRHLHVTDSTEGLRGVKTLFSNKVLWLNGIIGCLLYLPTTTFAELWGIPYLESVFNFSSSQAANSVALLFLGWAVGAPLMGLLSDSLRLRRTPQTIGALLATVVLIFLLYVPNLPGYAVYSALFLLGIFASVQVIVFPLGIEVSPAKLSGTAIALTNMFVMLGGVLFQPLVGVLLEWHGGYMVEQGVHVYTVADYRFALSALPIGMLVAAVLTRFLPETHGRALKE
jgi:sugar phosphate permease